MRILFLALTGSIHTARWISQLEGTGWDIHIYDAYEGRWHPDLHGVTLHAGWMKRPRPKNVKLRCRWPLLRGRHFLERRLPGLWRYLVPSGPDRMVSLIRRLKPDIIHSMNLQNEAYPLLEAKEKLGNTLSAPWICSCWGNDIYYFSNEKSHLPKIKSVLSSCDYFLADCKRDINLAGQHGFRGKALGVFPVCGGYEIKEYLKNNERSELNKRRIVLLKGYQRTFGRAITGLKAIEYCTEKLSGYEIVVYSCHQEVETEIKNRFKNLPVKISIFPKSSHKAILQLFGKARMSIGISTSDGIPNTVIESMIMGALPIQTDPGGATSEIIKNGVNGLIIPPDDPEKISEAIVRGLEDDDLVNSAAEINSEIVRKYERELIKKRVINMYEDIVQNYIKS